MKLTKTASALVAVLILAAGNPSVRAQSSLGADCNPATLTADFPQRDRLAESTVPAADWYKKDWNNGWGPPAATFPAVQPPAGCDAANWKRARVIAVARKYIGLHYRHHHIPGWNPSETLTKKTDAGAGLDCSNFTSWVYNYGLGLKFTSEIEEQAEGAKAPGRRLKADEPLQPGDLMYILKEDRSKISHVVIYIDETHIIDSHGATGGIKEHAATGWYKTHFAFARRVIQ